MGVVNHQLIDLVNTASDRFDKPTTPDDGVELEGDAQLLQLIENERPTEVLLLHHVVELRQLIGRMADVTKYKWLFILIDSHLGGCGTGIDDENSHE